MCVLSGGNKVFPANTPSVALLALVVVVVVVAVMLADAFGITTTITTCFLLLLRF